MFLGLAVSACAGGDIGTPLAASSTTSMPDEVEVEEPLPFDAAIGEAAGYSYAAIFKAVEAARAELVVECARAEGWDITVSDSYFRMPEAPPHFGGAARRVIEEMEADTAGQGGEAGPVGDPAATEANARDRTLSGCSAEAERELPDPAAPLLRWFDEQQAELQATIHADPRLVEARDRLPRCIAEGGYEYANSDEAGNDFFGRADSIFRAFRDGAVTREEALTELHALEEEERTVGETLVPCMEELLAAEREVAGDVQAAFLAEHGDEIAAAAAEVRDRIGPYEEYLAELTP